MTKKILILVSLFISLVSSAQETIVDGPQMADAFRADGKIYIVISVIAIIFLSIVVFLIAIERKLKKLENQIEQKELKN